MGYGYGRRRYRNWRGRNGYSTARFSKFFELAQLFGNAVEEIRSAFLALEPDAINELLADYAAKYGESAGAYAVKTFPSWRSGATRLSGQTMERLIELVPPYLEPSQRLEIVKKVVAKHEPNKLTTHIRIDVKDPTSGFEQLDTALRALKQSDVLAHVPERVMQAATWLYDDDVTAARAMVAAIKNAENDIMRNQAERDLALMKRVILANQIKSATYSVEMPAGKISVHAFEKSKCFVATVCFGPASSEVASLRQWRDTALQNTKYGRIFVIWYYNHGEILARLVERSIILRIVMRVLIRTIVRILRQKNGAIA